MDVTIHSCRVVRAKFERGDTSCWITFKFSTVRSADEICVFFNHKNAEYAERIAEAINKILPFPAIVPIPVPLEEESS